ELQAIGTDIRKLATEIPLSANALAGLVEQAGALGIAKGDVLAFAKASATIGVTTNVAADQAASALGGMATLLGVTGKDFERFSSALVDLGNKGASTEDQIIAIAERGAGAAATVGLTTEQLLGWASALANIKMEPEAAGTSFQRFALGVQKFTRAGGDELKLLAATAGVTAKEFAKAFDEDASGALESFIIGLSKLTKGERLDVITALGMDDARIGRMLLGLATAQDRTGDLSKSLNVSAEAWRANTAAAEEADKRYATVASKFALLNNQFTEGALLIGEGFLPALGRVADKLKIALGDEGVRNDLRSFGKDIGDAIDGIDFNKVLAAGREFVSLLKGAASFAKLAFDAVNMLPGPIKEAGLGFLALNKLSGGLIGAGAGNIIGGLAEVGIRGAGSRLPGAAGALFAQPVRVVNWPPGMGMGGPLGGLGQTGGAGLGAMFAGLVRFAIPALFATAILEQVSGFIAPGLRDILGIEAASPTPTAKFGPFDVGGSVAAQSRLAHQNRVTTFETGKDTGLLGKPTGPSTGGASPDERSEAKETAKTAEMAAILERGIAAGFRPTAAAVEATFAKNETHLMAIRAAIGTAAQQTAFAIRDMEPPPPPPAPKFEINVVNNISATGVTHTVVRTRRYGPTGGSREISEGSGHGPLI
ncbi:MAG: phage tail tape measure protein, partial [Candidatus Nanopelagicales bacterium]|nr:phage tail tape measure protein [Candidatus Nanopelagicales bacterium]